MFKAIKKQYRMAKLSKILGNPEPMGGSTFLESMEAYSEAKDQLMCLIVEDTQLSTIMAEYHADKDTLERIYGGLLNTGGGQMVAGGYLPVAALATNPTLRFLLRRAPKEGAENAAEEWARIVIMLIRYYESGSTGQVE
jgi:hypothetical protein